MGLHAPSRLGTGAGAWLLAPMATRPVTSRARVRYVRQGDTMRGGAGARQTCRAGHQVCYHCGLSSDSQSGDAGQVHTVALGPLQ